MNVYFYNNTKRHNSTALPPAYSEIRDCTFKQPTSLLEPILIVAFNTKPYYNYFSIDNRYYWITDIVSLKEDLWQISGKVDTLATYRRHIQNTSAFVLYDSTANTQIPDNRLAIKTDCDAYTASVAMPWDFDNGAGTYFVCTTGTKDNFDYYTGTTQTNVYEGTGVYIIPKTEIDNLGYDGADIATALYNSFTTARNEVTAAFTAAAQYDITTQTLQLLAALLKAAGLAFKNGFFCFHDCVRILATQLLGGGSALSNIRASYWLPFVIPAAASVATSKPLALGSYKDYISGLRRVDDPVITSAWVSVSIPWHFTDWRNASCTEVMLYIPLIGCINIPSEVVKGNSTIQVRIALNLYSGSMACEVRCDSANLGTYGANVAMPILIGDSNINVGAIANTITAAAATNPLGMVAGAAQSLTPMATSVGGIGGGAGTGLNNDIVCICRVHNTSQEPSALINTIGTPTNQLKQLNGSGYCQTMNAQMNNSLAGELTLHTIRDQVVATFNTNTAQPYSKLIVDINAYQEGEGTPAPDNVRPITGFANTRIDNNSIITTIDHGAAGTVYGGSLDVTSGVLTVTHGIITFDGSDEIWNDGTYRYSIEIANCERTVGRLEVLCNRGVFVSSGGSEGTVFATNKYLYYYPPTSITSLADFKTWLGSNNLVVVYPLATPVTYQLTPTQISAIVGTNRISSLTNGNINTLTYYTISTPEADPTETEILLVNNALNNGVYLE